MLAWHPYLTRPAVAPPSLPSPPPSPGHRRRMAHVRATDAATPTPCPHATPMPLAVAAAMAAATTAVTTRLRLPTAVVTTGARGALSAGLPMARRVQARTTARATVGAAEHALHRRRACVSCLTLSRQAGHSSNLQAYAEVTCCVHGHGRKWRRAATSEQRDRAIAMQNGRAGMAGNRQTVACGEGCGRARVGPLCTRAIEAGHGRQPAWQLASQLRAGHGQPSGGSGNDAVCMR